MQAQMDLILVTEEDSLREELAKIKTQMTNLRRGLFGRYDKLVNELTTLQENMSKIQEYLGITKEHGDKTEFFVPEEPPNYHCSETSLLNTLSMECD